MPVKLISTYALLYLAIGELAAGMGSPVSSLCPVPCHPFLNTSAPHPVCPLPNISSYQSCIAPHIITVESQIPHSTQNNCALLLPYKAIIVSYEDRQIKTNLGTVPWSLEKMLIQLKQVKMKLQEGHKFNQSKFWGFVNSGEPMACP